MQKLGMEVPMSEIKSIISKHDLMHDGVISFHEFKQIFKVEGVDREMPFGIDGPQGGKQLDAL
jgi:hypothetical protein